MTKKTIEHFLDSEVAQDYTVRNHHFLKLLWEVFAVRKRLFSQYTSEIKEGERFRNDLAAALASDSESQRVVAERWSYFLKPRIYVFELWSSLSTAFVAIFGFGGSLFALVSSFTNRPAPIDMMLFFAVVSAIFICLKVYIDKRAFWFKYVVSHLDAIAKIGSNPPLNRTCADVPRAG